MALIAATSTLTLTLADSAWAQAPNAANSSELEEVVVTASRLTTGGFNAPTPTQTLGTQELQQLAEPNIATSVAELPALSGSPNTSMGNGGTGNNNNGELQLNLRSMGTNRTLVLIDGQRIAPSITDGTADVGLLPQLLIKRVDVVTGGASASYGSDAVAGVVNFITDTQFTGFKSNVELGTTNYNDDRHGLVQMAWGTTGLDGRLHFETSGELYKSNGVPAPDPGNNGGPDGRTWQAFPRVVTRPIAATPAGQPENNYFSPTQFNTYSAYGLITSGPLKGTAFGANGSTYPFQYGSNCIASNCVGGDLSSNVSGSTATYDDPMRRGTVYARLGYDLAPKVELYTTLWYSNVQTSAQPNAGAAQQNNLSIQCSNPFVPASIQAACTANGITTLGNSANSGFGVSNIIFPRYIEVDTSHLQTRAVLGLNASDLDIFGKPWNLQSYVEWGHTDVDISMQNMMLLPRYNAAINATLLNGQIVCSDPTARANGCIPLDIIGQNPINPAAFSYIAPANGPYDNTSLQEKVASFALSGAPLNDWAGPISVAFGAEWREESYAANADPYGAGAAQTPYSAAYPADPVLGTGGNGWYAGDFHNGRGIFNVREAFLEVGLPLFDNNTAGKLDVDLGGRETHYSTAGSVFTWKMGAVWDTPLDGMRLRVVRSQDIRAPNLNELYAPTVVMSNAGIVDRLGIPGVLLPGAIVTALNAVQGNPQLKPEIAQNFEPGIVFQPSWAKSFRASFDYYHIKVTGAVQTLTAQQQVDLCQISNNANACALVYFSPVQGAIDNNLIVTSPFNAATITLDGFDIAAGYQFDLGRVGLPGTLELLGQASHVIKFLEDPGIPGQPLLDAAGANAPIIGGNTSGTFGIAPNWKGLVTEGWSTPKGGVSLIERFVSAGTINPTYQQCTPGSCPVATLQNPTINYNHIAGAVYLDISANYTVGEHVQLYAKIDNTLNHNPPPLGTPALFDWLGRFYRVGFRYTLK
jgi:outer membrane receptor protein involved in Fe transport